VATLTMDKLGERGGVNLETIRYYERREPDELCDDVVRQIETKGSQARDQTCPASHERFLRRRVLRERMPDS